MTEQKNKQPASLWSELHTTPGSAVKTNTGNKSTKKSIDGYYMFRKASETFGPCGIGWGYEIVEERIEDGKPNVVLNKETQQPEQHHDKNHTIKLKLWYKYNGEQGEIVQFGHTKAMYYSNKGYWVHDEEAPKKSLTDAIKKALSMLGIGGDVFTGQFNDVNYERQQNEIEQLDQADEVASARATALAEIHDFAQSIVNALSAVSNAQAINLGYKGKRTDLFNKLNRFNTEYKQDPVDVEKYLFSIDGKVNELKAKLEGGNNE